MAGERERRKGKVIVALVAAMLLIAAGFAAVSLIHTSSEVADALTGTERGRKSVTRVRTVLASGDLASPAGTTLKMTIMCSLRDSSADRPRLVLTPTDANLDPLRAQLRDREWKVRTLPFGDLYEKEFDGWTAGIGFLGWQALLDVGEDTFGADCPTFRDGLRNVTAPTPGG